MESANTVAAMNRRPRLLVGRRYLPESAYDFWVRDSRDGELWGPYATRAEAVRQRDDLRAYVETYQRCCYYVGHEVNEKKVAAMLRGAET